ncbi:hypothetical protein N7481_008403 [Penicillium waksmanii]|uniref:uncharacterized protein n=1 Tax=Penicillium waksmanii TaxID=69791 RepID=UPI002549260C|nr:uncharacterized protein N7481_008403 [Penicillium waksmanii]KAJ5981105.1 hypothetical protein N7481_008403 [Penicillium waksmanii]
MDLLSDRANLLAVQRLQFFRGCAVIDFNHLFFEDAALLGSREYSQDNVDRLIKIFQIEGCCNMEPEHRVAAVVDSDKLKNALSISGITQEQLLDPTTQITLGFEEGTRLMCIFGKHRLRAAQAIGMRSWLVDIYVDGWSYSSCVH